MRDPFSSSCRICQSNIRAVVDRIKNLAKYLLNSFIPYDFYFVFFLNHFRFDSGGAAMRNALYLILEVWLLSGIYLFL